MPESNNIYRTLGSIEAKQDALLISLNLINTNISAFEKRLNAVERTQSKMLGYGFGFATITTLAALGATLRELIL